jgi:outer membrane protein assembly factor BamD
MRRPPALRLTSLLLVVLLVGCASDGDKKVVRDNPFEKESRAERRLAKLTVEQLYDSAKEALDSGDPKRALELYGEVEARHPFTKYATQSQLDSIYAHFRAAEPELAISAANRFTKQHPQHAEIDYVYYLKGLVNFERASDEFDKLLGVDGARRDPVYSRTAFEDFSLLIKRFPESKYSHDARRRMIYLREGLSRYELHVADFYLSRRAWVAASRRAQYVLDHYQGTRAVAPALDILEQCYKKLGLEKPAADAHSTLVANFPDYLKHKGSGERTWWDWLGRFDDPFTKLLD